MTRGEFERNKGRFGDDIDAWPPPFRQEARAFLASGGEFEGDPDGTLDRLVLEAALIDDDPMLARKVLARIETGRGPARSSFLPQFILAPTGLAACAAAVLMAATVAGYQVARLQNDLPDTELLALASGIRLTDDGVPGITADPVTEEDSL